MTVVMTNNDYNLTWTAPNWTAYTEVFTQASLTQEPDHFNSTFVVSNLSIEDYRLVFDVHVWGEKCDIWIFPVAS